MAMQMAQQGLLSRDELIAVTKGLQQYDTAPRGNGSSERRQCAAYGCAALYGYGESTAGKTPVVLVPSVINSARIFDLLPDQSFIRFLQREAGNPLYLLDWGDLKQDETAAGLEALVTGKLLPALREIKAREGAAPVLIGYCLGGLLSLAACILAPAGVAALTFLATPWDFNDADDATAARVRAFQDAIAPALKTTPLFPAASLYGFFASLPGSDTPQKFSRFANRAEDDAARDLFIAVEDWAQEGADLPAPLLDEILSVFYRRNETGRNAWHVGGALIDPAKIAVPSFHVAPENDRIISPASARALQASMPGSTLYAPDCGHVGLMAGRCARGGIWPEIARFLVQCKTAAPLS